MFISYSNFDVGNGYATCYAMCALPHSDIEFVCLGLLSCYGNVLGLMHYMDATDMVQYL